MTKPIAILGSEDDFPSALRALLGSFQCAVVAAGDQAVNAIDLPDDVETLVLVSPEFSGPLPVEQAFDRPVLAIFGTRDEWRTLKEERLRAVFPHAYVTYVYDASAIIATDRPKALARLIGDFLHRKEAFLVNEDDGLLLP